MTQFKGEDILTTRIRELRHGSGLSLAELAKRLGISKAHCWDLETGRTVNPTLQTLRLYSRMFGVKIAWIIGEDY